MAQIRRLQIQGIRSFGPEEENRQNVEFFSPLTLILGQNGCGKTTIIECLKYVSTGDPPPGSSKGSSFVHDPKMARESSVKGQVKMQFTTHAGNNVKTICRSIEASQKIKNITIKTLDSTISTVNRDTGEKSQLSSKCADINAEMFNSLGVSRPILNYVIFCHQEDSNWPLEEGSKVKEKFDEIFNSAKYQKCLKNIKDVRKAELEKAKLDKNNMEHYKSDKEYSDNKARELDRKEKELKSILSEIDQITTKLQPIRQSIKEVQEEEQGFSDVRKKLGEAQTSLEHVQKERRRLADQISEILPDTVSMEEVLKMKNGIEKESRGKQSEVSSLEEDIVKTTRDIEKLDLSLQKNAAEVGKALQSRNQHKETVKERDTLLTEAQEVLGISPDEDADFSKILKLEEQKMQRKMKSCIAENNEKIEEANGDLRKLHVKKAEHETARKQATETMVLNKKEAAQIKRQLGELEGAEEQLHTLKKDVGKVQTDLERAKNEFDLDDMMKEIEQEKVAVRDMDNKERNLREECKRLEESQTILSKIAHIEDDIARKKEKIDKISNKRARDFRNLFQLVPDPKRIKNLWKDGLEDAEKKFKDLEVKKTSKENDFAVKNTSKKDLRKIIDKSANKKVQLESKIGDIISPEEDLEEEIEKQKERLRVSQQELSCKEAGKFTFQEMIDTLKSFDHRGCPTCHRDFDDIQEGRELVEELEREIKKIPKTVKNLELKVNLLTTKLEAMQKVRPEVHELKIMKGDHANNVKKLAELEKEIKSLRESIEDDEELKSAEELFLKFKETGEDVQLIDSVSKELELLTGKKADLSMSSQEFGGERRLDDVRKEEEENGKKLREARKNLDSCQQTVNKQTTLINDLEGKKNKLVNKQLDIEGKQQQRANMIRKKDELEAKVEAFRNEQKTNEEALEPIKDQLEEAENKKRKLQNDADKERGTLQEKLNKTGSFASEFNRHSALIQEYEESGQKDKLDELMKLKKEIEKKIEKEKNVQKTDEERITELKVDLSNTESRKRMYDDNLRLRECREEERKYENKVKTQEKVLEEMDWRNVEKKKDKLTREYHDLNAEKNAKEGQIAEIERSVGSMKRELNQPKLKDAKAKFKEMSIKHSLRVKVAEDLNTYYSALDYAIMRFHKDKMRAVNKIIRELWRSTYRGNDIDYIEVKTDDSDASTAGADKRKSYNYRVVMIKNETELDMRGRCSAGQKVLSSLIIRLALAETFSNNCGVIALDEPTTNLDRENIASLAEALVDLVDKRSNQRNFQLVVITHDEDFITDLSRCDRLEYYQRVSRNQKGLSEVRKRDTASLN